MASPVSSCSQAYSNTTVSAVKDGVYAVRQVVPKWEIRCTNEEILNAGPSNVSKWGTGKHKTVEVVALPQPIETRHGSVINVSTTGGAFS